MVRRLTSVLLLVALISAACSNDSSSADSEDAGVDAEEAGPELRVALLELDSLDPVAQRITSPSAMMAMDLLLDGLTTIDPATGEVAPKLAESWQVSDSGLQWRFDIDTEATAGGRPLVTAGDVKWTLARIAQQGEQSIPGSALAPVLGYENASVSAGSAEFDGVDAVRSDRVVIQLREPFAALPALLAHPAFGILPEGADEVPLDPAAVDPLSSAFRVQEVSDAQVVLKAGDRFEGTVGQVTIDWATDEAMALDSVMNGDADLAPVDAKQAGLSEFELVEPYGATVFFGMNIGHPTLTNPAFRRAIVQGVDRTKLLTDVFGATAAPLAGLIPEPDRDVCGDACAYSPDMAEQLIELAFGAEPAPTVEIDYPVDDDVEQELAEAVAESLAAVGVQTRLRPATVEELEERIAEGRHQLFRFGWVSAYDDQQAWLDSPFRSDGSDNVFNLDDPDIDDQIRDLGQTTGDRRRALAAEELERDIMTEYVVIPVLARQQVVAYDERVANLKLRSDGTFDLAALTLD